MLKKYLKELEKKGIDNVDILLEDGRFYSNLKPIQTNDEQDYNLVGFNGVINLEENEPSLIYTQRNCKSDKNILTTYSNVLVLDNYNGENKLISLSQVEERDCIELYEEYLLNSDLFEKKQHILEKKYNSSMKLKFFDIQRDFLKEVVDSLYDELEEIEEKIKKSHLRLVKVRK